MTALFVLQVVTLGLVALVLAALLITSFSDSSRARFHEAYLLGLAYGLTLSTILATLFIISIPN